MSQGPATDFGGRSACGLQSASEVASGCEGVTATLGPSPPDMQRVLLVSGFLTVRGASRPLAPPDV